MGISIPVVWTDAHRLHDPATAVWIGVPIPADELLERAEAIRAALEEAGASIVLAEPHPDDPLLAVHDPELVAFLRGAWEAWVAAGLPTDPGQPNVVGYICPTPALLAGVAPRVPIALSARTGAYCYVTMTVVAEGTWKAARAAVDAALTAADLVLGGKPAAYTYCRPPGHHVTRGAFGGSCYLNNSAIPLSTSETAASLVSLSSTSMRTTETERRRSSGSAATCPPARCTWTRRTAGSRTSSGSRTSAAADRERERT